MMTKQKGITKIHKKISGCPGNFEPQITPQERQHHRYCGGGGGRGDDLFVFSDTIEPGRLPLSPVTSMSVTVCDTLCVQVDLPVFELFVCPLRIVLRYPLLLQ